GVVSSLAIGDDEEIVVTTAAGVVMRTQAGDISIQKRSAQGVRIIRVDDGDKVTSVTVVPAEEEEDVPSDSSGPVDDAQQSLFTDTEE
ncbi:MAG TPA: hypothetical protein O0X76_03820, partial [Methanocorpusculum sp.]|nr:hypothetical protein [Methanocorpusculum sp.]